MRVLAYDPQSNLSVGEYTGINKVTGNHCVSFYNGYTKEFKNIKHITFVDHKNVHTI